MGELSIRNNLRAGWSEFQGQYRGSFFDPLEFLPLIDAYPQHKEQRDRKREAFNLAKQVCEQRDLWKQNEVDAIADMLHQILEHIDNVKER